MYIRNNENLYFKDGLKLLSKTELIAFAKNFPNFNQFMGETKQAFIDCQSDINNELNNMDIVIKP